MYFNCNKKARVDADQTVFTNGAGGFCFSRDPKKAVALTQQATESAGDFVANGGTLVNWANVCYVRVFEPREEDEE